MNIALIISYMMIVVGLGLMYHKIGKNPRSPEERHNLPYSSGIMFFILGLLGMILSKEMIGFQVDGTMWIGLTAFTTLWVLGIIRDFKETRTSEAQLN